MDHLQKNDKTEKATELLGRKNKKGERKRESNGSPEIPDRGGNTEDISGLPSGSCK